MARMGQRRHSLQDQELLCELTSRPPQEAADCLINMVVPRGAPDNASRSSSRFFNCCDAGTSIRHVSSNALRTGIAGRPKRGND